MPQYRGSPMTNGNVCVRVIGFAKGLFSHVAPHLSNAGIKARSNTRTLASKVLKSVIDSARKRSRNAELGTTGQGY